MSFSAKGSLWGLWSGLKIFPQWCGTCFGGRNAPKPTWCNSFRPHNHLPRTRKDSFLTLLWRKIHFFQNYSKLKLKWAFQLTDGCSLHRCSPPTSSSAAPWNDVELNYWHPNLHMTLLLYYFLTLFIHIIWFTILLQLHIISYSWTQLITISDTDLVPPHIF